MSVDGRARPGGSDAARAVTPIVRVAPAKLNLTLAVVGRRPDGFHDLHSIMVPLSLGDRLAFTPAHGARDQLHVTTGGAGQAPDLGPAEANLALKAIGAARRALRDHGVDAPLPALAVRLEKRIPVAAGLAGGSSDAAAALGGALEAWGVAEALDGQGRAEVAASIGSDVPFFLAGGWALVEGRGERVAPLRPPAGEPPWVLLATPGVAVGTPDVFGLYAAGIRPAGAASLATSSHLAAELGNGLPSARLLERAGLLAVANDLVPATAALVPELATFRRRLSRLLGRSIGQSGSGPTLWALYPSRAAAIDAVAVVTRARLDGSLQCPGDGSLFVEAAWIPLAPPATGPLASPVAAPLAEGDRP